MPLAVLLWIACGPAAAVIARHYGADPARWLLMGVALGPAGLALSFGSGSDRRCPHCSRHVERMARVCPHCRADIGATALGPPVFTCSSCGYRASTRPGFCPNCHEPFRQREDSVDPLVDSKNVRAMYAWFSVWIMLLGGAAVYTFLDDPTRGHVGRLVYADEAIMDGRTPVDTRTIPLRRPFRVAKDDRIERIPDVRTESSTRAWIRITSGTHAGRSGVIVW